MGAPPGADGRDRAGVRPARDADAAPAGEAHDDRPDVPLRPPAGRPLPPVLAVRRGGDRRSGPGDRRRDHRARRTGSTRRPASRASRCSSTRSATRPAARRTSPRSWTTTAGTPTRCRRPSATAWSATPSGCSTRRTRRWPSSTRPRPGSPTTCARRARRTSTSVKAHLEALGVPFRVEPGLVRGLDYYTRTAFEFYVAGREGQQQALGGGGRYDGLVELLGGKPTPGIGFGLGLDRVALVLAEQGHAAGGRRTGRSRSSPARTRRTRSGGCGSRRSSGPPACASARTSAGASSGASWRPRARTARTSR